MHLRPSHFFAGFSLVEHAHAPLPVLVFRLITGRKPLQFSLIQIERSVFHVQRLENPFLIKFFQRLAGDCFDDHPEDRVPDMIFIIRARLETEWYPAVRLDAFAVTFMGSSIDAFGNVPA